MSAVIYNKKITSLTWTAGGKDQRQLPCANVWRKMWLRYSGTQTVAGAANVQANVLRGDELACYGRMSLYVNGGTLIRQFTPTELWWFNLIVLKRSPKTSTNLGDAATLNPAYDIHLEVPFAFPWMRQNPIQTSLDTRSLQSLQIEHEFNAATACLAAATGFSGTVDVSAEMHDDSDPKSPFAPGSPLFIKSKICRVTDSWAGATTKDMDLPIGPDITGILINIQDTSAPTLDSGTILTNIRIKDANNVYLELPEETVWERTMQRIPGGRQFNRALSATNGVTVAASTVNPGALARLRQNPKEDLAGWYYLDFTDPEYGGYITEAIKTSEVGKCYLSLDTSAAGNVVYYPIMCQRPIVAGG